MMVDLVYAGMGILLPFALTTLCFVSNDKIVCLAALITASIYI